MQDEVEMRTEELARWTVERLKSLGADCASAEVSHDKGLSVTVRMGEVDAVEHTEERVLTLNAWIGGRKGCASTADFSERSLEAAVQAAVDIARVSAEDPAAGLPEAEDLQADMRDLSLWHPFEGGVQEAVRLASAVEEAVFEADERIVNSDGTNFSTSSGEFTLANSLGFCAGYRYSRHDMDAAPMPRTTPACSATAGGRRGAPSRIFWTPPSSDARLPGARSLALAQGRCRAVVRGCSLMRPWRRDFWTFLKNSSTGAPGTGMRAVSREGLASGFFLLMSPWRRIPIS